MDELAALERTAAEVTEERQRLGRDQQRLEDEIATLTDKAGRTDKLLYGGTVSNPRELQAMQDEIAALEATGQPARRPRARADGGCSSRSTSACWISISSGPALDEQAASLRAAIAEAEVALGAEAARVQSERSRSPARSTGRSLLSTSRCAPPGRHSHRTTGRRAVRRVPPLPLRGRDGSHQAAAARRGGAVRGVRATPRSLSGECQHVCLWFIGPSVLIVWSVFRSPARGLQAGRARRSAAAGRASRRRGRGCSTPCLRRCL